MKLFSETGSITEIWEEDKENNKDEIKESPNIKPRSKIAVMYENTFYNHPKLDCVKKNVFGTLKGKRKITPSSSDISVDKPASPQQPCSSENINMNLSVVNNTCKEVEHINNIDLNSSVEYPEKVKAGISTAKPSLQRGKSDIRQNRNTRRHTDYCIESTPNCRTEFAIPGEFLFCSEVEHSNKFASLYKKISSSGKLRRSMSTGTLGKAESNKTDLDLPRTTARKSVQIKEATKDDKSTHSNTHNNSMRNTCEKLYSKKSGEFIERKSSKRHSKNILAGELQSIIDNENDDVTRTNTCRTNPERETSFIENSNSNNNGDSNLNIPEQVSSNTRNPANRRSQSCKSAQKRHSHLFNISKYLKDRNTQRSKSFATIREFSTHDVNLRKTSTMYGDRYDGSYTAPNVSDGQSNIDEQHNTNDRQTPDFAKDLELTPIKTTRSFDINHTDSRGNSCLHHASSKGDISTIKYLLAQGGDVWVKNDEHRLPMDLAQNFQTAKLLSSATLFYSDQNEQRNERNISETSKLNIAL